LTYSPLIGEVVPGVGKPSTLSCSLSIKPAHRHRKMSFLDHLLMYPSQWSSLLSITVDGCRSVLKFYSRILTKIPTAVTDFRHGVTEVLYLSPLMHTNYFNC